MVHTERKKQRTKPSREHRHNRYAVTLGDKG